MDRKKKLWSRWCFTLYAQFLIFKWKRGAWIFSH